LIQMMQAKTNLDDDQTEKLKLISAQIQRITQVTKDMMDFARVRPAAKTLVNINQLIAASLRLASFDKSFQNLRLVKDLTENLPEVFADNDQLQQVFLNLFLNARDAMPDGGELLVKTSNSNQEVKIEIADSGIGIDAQNLPQIFNPFFTTKQTGKGTGLGLAVCYGIITAHNGKIEASANDKNGTTFSVTLPVNSNEQSVVNREFLPNQTA